MASIRWFKHCKTQEEKERFEKRLTLVKDVFNVLEDLLKEDLEVSNRKIKDEENFTLPAWSEYQAYHLGMQKQAEKILNLIKHKE